MKKKDLELKIDENLIAFEKDKIYCIKVKIPSDYPKEFIQTHCEAILEVFNRKNIQIIVIPCIEGEIDFEFVQISKEDKIEEDKS